MTSLNSIFGNGATVLRKTNFQILLFASLTPILGTSLISPLLSSLIQPLNASTANIGLMISSQTAPAIIMIPVAGILADSYGRKPILVFSLLLFGVGGVAIAFTNDFHAALGLRFLQGVGFGGISPIAITSIGDLYSHEEGATAQGLRTMGAGLSGAIFPLIGGFLVTIAWQYPFLLYGIAIPAAGFVYWWMDEPISVENKMSERGSREYFGKFLKFIWRPRILPLIIARALPVVTWTAFLTYNSIIVTQIIGGTPFEAGILVTVGMFAVALASSQAGRVLGLFSGYFTPLLLANVLLCLGFLGLLFMPGMELAVSSIGISGTGFGLSLSLYRGVISERSPEHLRAGLVSVSEAGGRLSATLTPIIMGAIIGIFPASFALDFSIRIVGVGAAFVGGIGGVLCIILVKINSRALSGL
ncbi:MFS transporter [Halobellus sp. GM3]|uniref:MFS transporter n=1 Tax=Halobellus sp. GM3 TaxID=3458410 RepID=UPI00403D8DF3